MAIGRFGIGLYALEEYRRCMVAANEMMAYARAIMEPCAFGNWEKTARPEEGCNELLKQGLTNLGQSAGWFFGTWATLRNAAYGTSTYR